MIFDTLANIHRYDGLKPAALAAALKFLQQTNLADLPVGRQDLDGDNLYLLVQEYTTRLPDAGKWEAHRRYIDVQYMVVGWERMYFANLSTMRLGEYLPEKDFQQLSGAGSYVDVFAGSFVIFFPEDGHMPCMAVNTPQIVKKVVLKIKVE